MGYYQGGTKSAPPDPDEDDERLTDDDLFALLVRDGFGGFNGFTYAAYLDTPDAAIRDSYFAERDDDHRLVTLRERRARARQGGLSGSIARAGRELPSKETLDVPEEAFAVNGRAGMAYCLMFWQTWRRRQREGVLTEDGFPIDTSYIMARWKKVAGAGVR